MTTSVPFRLMRMRIVAVEAAVAQMSSRSDFPDDKQYLALTFGMLEATAKNRNLTRVQIEARLVAWIMHFENGVKLLPEGHPLKGEMTQATIEFRKWIGVQTT